VLIRVAVHDALDEADHIVDIDAGQPAMSSRPNGAQPSDNRRPAVT
jgi:hypothetical protein